MSEVVVVKPGGSYRGAQGFTYGAGVSNATAGAEAICMNVLPMPDGAQAKVHHHDGIETIAYLLEGRCRVYYGDRLQGMVEVEAGDQVYVPASLPHAPCNRSGSACTWLVVHSSGSDQDGIVMLPELDEVLARIVA